MSRPWSDIDEIVSLYVVTKLGLREIGRRFEIDAQEVRRRLVKAGVEIRPRGRAADSWLPPMQPNSPKPGPKPVAQQEALALADAQHVNAVISALNGHGFPFAAFRRSAA